MPYNESKKKKKSEETSFFKIEAELEKHNIYQNL